MHFSIIKCNPEGTPPSHGFDDAILPLFFALRALGYDTEILCNRFNPGSRNIVFGSCIAPRRIGRLMPRGSIIFNLEQIIAGSKWCNKDYLSHLNDYSVWDYSEKNITELRALGIRDITHVPLGYVPEMTRLSGSVIPQADALFYGLITDRRDALIRRITDQGVKILASQDAFGDLRDKLLAHARVTLNIHQFLPARLEVVRLGYVWANKRPVLSEWREDSDIPDHLRAACYFAPYDAVPEALERLLHDEALRRKQAEQGFAAFSSQPMAASLEKVVGKRAAANASRKLVPASLPSPLLDRPYLLSPAHEWSVQALC